MTVDKPQLNNSDYYCCYFLHPFIGLFSDNLGKGKTSLDLNEARDDGDLGWQWHQLDLMQTICTSLQTSAPHYSIFTGRMLFFTPN